MKNSKAMEKGEPPKRPLNVYFRFRKEKMDEYKEDPSRAQKIKDEWNALDPKTKGEMEQKYKENIQVWKTQMEDYTQKYGKPEQKRQSRRHKGEEPEKE